MLLLLTGPYLLMLDVRQKHASLFQQARTWVQEPCTAAAQLFPTINVQALCATKFVKSVCYQTFRLDALYMPVLAHVAQVHCQMSMPHYGHFTIYVQPH